MRKYAARDLSLGLATCSIQSYLFTYTRLQNIPTFNIWFTPVLSHVTQPVVETTSISDAVAIRFPGTVGRTDTLAASSLPTNYYTICGSVLTLVQGQEGLMAQTVLNKGWWDKAAVTELGRNFVSNVKKVRLTYVRYLL